MRVIKYKGASYPAKEIELDNKTTVLVSVSFLQDALLDNNDEYVDKEAKNIDEKIFYYLNHDEFMLSKDEIKKLLISI